MLRRFLIVIVAFLFLESCKNPVTKDSSWEEVYKNAYTNQDYTTAVVALNHLIITDSSNQKAYYDSLSVYYFKKLRNYGAAKKTVDKALALNPDNYQLLEFKSAFLTEENKIDDSRAVLQKAYKLSGQNKYLYLYAMTYATEQNLTEYNKITNGILYNPATKPEKVEVPIDENNFQFVDLKAVCYLDKAKILAGSGSTDGAAILRYIDSSLTVAPDYQQALFMKEKLVGGRGQ
jgi:tetratricopeptide (TPR) repeat protein